MIPGEQPVQSLKCIRIFFSSCRQSISVPSALLQLRQHTGGDLCIDDFARASTVRSLDDRASLRGVRIHRPYKLVLVNKGGVICKTTGGQFLLLGRPVGLPEMKQNVDLQWQ